MSGYTRQSAADIQEGNIVEAQPLNNEYNAIQAAFNALSGHKHDGTTGEGAPITVVGPTRNVYASATALYPRVTATIDLGTTELRYKDLYLSGAAAITGNVTAARFNGSGAGITGIVDASLPSTIVRTSRTIVAGLGLYGGGDFSANRSLAVGQGDGITVSTSTVGVDSTVVRTSGSQTIGGNKTFTGNQLFLTSTSGSQTSPSIEFSEGSGIGHATGNIRLSLITGGTRRLFVGDDGVVRTSGALEVAGNTVVSGVISGNGSGLTNLSTSSLSGTISDGNLPSNIVRTTRTISAGNGLTGGGDLSANRTLAVGQGDGITVATTSVGVDSTVVRTSGSQTLSGTKTFANILVANGINANNNPIYNVIDPTNTHHVANKQYVDTTVAAVSSDVSTNYVPVVRQILTGNGLSGGGNLTTNRTLSVTASDGISVSSAGVAVDNTVVRTSRTITAGNGLTGGGDLSANRSVAVGAGDGITVASTSVGVDSTVVRTSGTQSIGGAKTFTSITLSGNMNAGNNNIINVADPTTPLHAANKAYVDQQDGVGQVWTDLTSTRISGTSYRNTTGREIFITGYSSGTDNTFQVSENNTTWQTASRSREIGGAARHFFSVPVLPNQYYRLSAGPVESWIERR